MEDVGNPPPNNDPPHDNPLYGNRTLQDYLHPPRTTTPSCIMFPPNVQHQEFKSGMFQLLPIFHGLNKENPYVHIREFEEIVVTFQSRPEALNTVKLRFFSFSLKDNTKVWLYSLRLRSIGSWDEMTQAFFQKYFPAHKTNNLKKQIQNFTQKDSEKLYQVWEQFKTLLSSCPHHGFESWQVVSYFYDAILSWDRQFVESMCNGEFLQKEPEEAIDILDDISEKSLN